MECVYVCGGEKFLKYEVVCHYVMRKSSARKELLNHNSLSCRKLHFDYSIYIIAGEGDERSGHFHRPVTPGG